MLEIKKCEICGSTNLIEVLNLGNHPLCDDLKKVGSSEVCKEYPITILYCESCKSAHQKYQIQKQILFPKEYHYRSKQTNDVLNGMKNLVASVAETFGDLKNKKVLDIGCNDGSLLDIFSDFGAITFGVEPTFAALDANAKHKIFNTYFDSDIAEILKGEKFDFITFTNVFAHIENLDNLLYSLNKIINNETIIVIENHYLGSILNSLQFDTFYHEHPRTYSLSSFEFIAKKLNKKITKVEFPQRYGGNIRIFLGEKAKDSIESIKLKEQNFLNEFKNMNNRIKIWQEKKGQEIFNLIKKFGKLHAKAFPGRAAILLKMLNLNENHLSGIYEKKDSKKIGFYAPSTKIPILSDELLFTQNHDIVLNLAWHISGEIRQYLESNAKIHNIKIDKIIDILDKDF
ncbi:class I SAM-dependent methyltransferase [Helicobacter saguini]|nr:methyltransferase domain-containing protein [Helicobacter saguini]